MIVKIAALVCLLVCRTVWAAEPIRGGRFSKDAIGLQSVYVTRQPMAIPSPDNRSRVTINATDTHFFADVQGDIGKGQFDIAYGPNAELLWAPDSKSFFITENDGGLIGPYLLKVVGIVEGKLVSRDVTPLVVKSFGRPVRCFDPEEPNVAGVGWLKSSRVLLAIAEILPHSNCDSMGTFVAYEIDVAAMQVGKRYDQLETKRLFGNMLGPGLMNASDECVRNPKQCFIPQLHTEGR